MKCIHLCLATLICVSASIAGSTAACADDPTGRLGGLTTDIVFRAQSGGVPLPPGAQVIPQSAPVLPVPSTPYGSSGIVPMSGTMLPQTAAPTPIPQSGSAPMTWNAFSVPQQYSDPFAPGGSPVAPYAPYTPYGIGSQIPGAGGGFSTFGANQPGPFRMGWQNRLELEWIPESGVTTGASDNFEQFGVDYDLAFTGPFMPGWVMTWTNQFRYRAWDGPIGGPGIPGKGFRFGMDLALETSMPSPINFQIAVNPSINTDLDGSLESQAWQIDGRAIMMAQLNQYWSLMLGAGYWDRVTDRVIPYVGLIYRDDFWDVKLAIPEAEIALFLGNEAQWSKWMYFRAEYHVEAFQVTTAGGGRDEVELEDIRLMLGFRMKAPMYTWFVEGGWVIDRDIDYGSAANADFEQETSFLGRLGWKY